MKKYNDNEKIKCNLEEFSRKNRNDKQLLEWAEYDTTDTQHRRFPIVANAGSFFLINNNNRLIWIRNGEIFWINI